MIEFDNETENFELPSKAALSPTHFFTTRITYNGNSKRMNVPHLIRQRFIDSPFVRFYWVANTSTLYIDFKPNDNELVPEGADSKDTQITPTGRGYFVTLPTKWLKQIKPDKASLMQIEEKKTVYKVQFYGNAQ